MQSVGRLADVRVAGAAGHIALRREDELEAAAAQIFIAPAALRRVDLLFVHGLHHGVADVVHALEPEGVERQVGNFIVFVHNEHDLVVILRPGAIDHVVLVLRRGAHERAVLAGQQLLPDVEAGVEATHGVKVGRVVAAVHGLHDVLQQLGRVGLDDGAVGILGIDGEAHVIRVLDAADIVVDLVVGVFEIFLELRQVVRLAGRAADHGVEHAVHDRVGVDLIEVVRIRTVILCARHGREHPGHVHGVCLDRQRVGRERLLLHGVDVGLKAVRERQNERDADDADRAGECGEQGAGLFRHKVVQRQAHGRCKAHGRVLLDLDRHGCGRLGFRAGVIVADDPAVEQAHGARGVFRRQLRVVRDHDDELIFCDLLQQIHDLHARLTVERTGRFVGEQNVGVVDDGARDGHALHLAAGHLVRRFVELVAQADLFQRLDGARAPLLTGDARERQRELNVGQHALVRDEVVALKDKADGVVAVRVPVAVVVLLCGAAVDNEVAGGVAVQAADDVQQRGLAAAGLAQDRNELVFTKGNVDALECFDLRRAGLVDFGDVFQFQHGWDAPLYGCRAAAQP